MHNKCASPPSQYTVQSHLAAAGQRERAEVRVGGKSEASDLSQLGTLAEVKDPKLPQSSQGVIRKAGEEVLAKGQLLQPLEMLKLTCRNFVKTVGGQL